MRIPEISTPKNEHMIDGGGRKLDCCVFGNGSPTVVLVSALETPQEYWNSVILELAVKLMVEMSFGSSPPYPLMSGGD